MKYLIFSIYSKHIISESIFVEKKNWRDFDSNEKLLRFIFQQTWLSKNLMKKLHS